MDKHSKIYIAGHRGLVGSAIQRKLQADGYTNLIVKTHDELNLERQVEVEDFFKKENPEYVFLAAAKVGGIFANDTYPAEFIHFNLMIQGNIIDSAYESSVKKLVFLGSSCIYPRDCPQPIKEEYLLSGKLEPTNEPYAIAKIAGIKMCQAYNRQYGTRFISVMPTNLFGPHDNFNLETSHVLPALVRKFHLAKLASQGEWGEIMRDESHFGHIPNDIMVNLIAITQSKGYKLPSDISAINLAKQNIDSSPTVRIWGTGSPHREFLHVDDLAEACLFVMKNYDHNEMINIGSGKEISILHLANMIKELIGFKGEISFDPTKPDGTPRKLLDISRLESLGWRTQFSLQEGLKNTYQWYLNRTMNKV